MRSGESRLTQPLRISSLTRSTLRRRHRNQIRIVPHLSRRSLRSQARSCSRSDLDLLEAYVETTKPPSRQLTVRLDGDKR
jgi:hypothetical protein